MVPHLRGAFKRAAVFQIRGDARGAKGVVADARGDAAGFGAALNHRIGVLLVAGFHVRCLQNVIKKRNWGKMASRCDHFIEMGLLDF